MTATAEIARNIPVPPPRSIGTRAEKLRRLRVGDSLFVATEGDDQHYTQIRVSAAAARCAPGTGRKFTTRQVTENGVTGVRVWRVA